jgi:DNA-directed RNA polymerase sigma subunit (sigma70/sigma32)
LDDSEAEACLEDRSPEGVPSYLVGLVTREDKSETKSESENRKILLDVFLGERSLADIGRELGISREAVRKKTQKAISRIRNRNASAFKEYMK